jgi:hypothetical protein
VHVAELVNKFVGLAHRVVHLPIQDGVYEGIVTYGDTTDHDAIAHPSISRDNSAQRHRRRSVWMIAQIHTKTEALGFVDAELQTQPSHLLREAGNSSEYFSRRADCIPVVHVKPGSATALRQLSIQPTDRVMDGSTEGCAG